MVQKCFAQKLGGSEVHRSEMVRFGNEVVQRNALVHLSPFLPPRGETTSSLDGAGQVQEHGEEKSKEGIINITITIIIIIIIIMIIIIILMIIIIIIIIIKQQY